MNRSHPEGERLLLCISTVRTALAGATKIETAQRKTPKGGQRERTHREEHGAPAGYMKNFRAPAMLKTTPLDCEIKCSLREKRRDPWPGANASSKAMADPRPMVKTREKRESQACLDLVCRPVAQPPVEASLKASLKIRASQAAGRPCYEAENSACRGEWRREAGSP